MPVTSLSGFPELLPAERLAEQSMLDQLRETFELHGFAPVETRSVEPLDVLRKSAGGEIDKEVYVLRRLRAEGEEGDAGLALHYDLTVPFARYVLDTAGRLEFPFRRYQIQKAWRGERPQEGRYREFNQVDIDVVGREELPFHHDVEVARVMAEALARLTFLPPLRLQINNRRLIEGFCRGLGISDIAGVLRNLDKIDKVSAEIVGRALKEEVGLSAAQVDMCLAFGDIRSADTSFVDRVRSLGVEHELLDTGLAELAQVVRACEGMASNRFAVEADLRIARGLDYYTGTVFETRMAGFESIGSVCSGGRYDSLASDARTTYPGVGLSLGVTRMLTPLFQRGLLTASRAVPSAVLVALPDDDARERGDRIAQVLRARGIAVEVAPAAQKYGRQIRHAERRGIPFVWFPKDEDGDEVRDIRSGEQVAADASSWSPPPEDLRPRVIWQGEGE